VHKDDSIGILEDRRVFLRPEVWTPPVGRDHRRGIGHQGIVDVIGNTYVGNDFERANGVPGLGECHVLGSDDGRANHGISLSGEVVESSLHNDLGLLSFSVVGSIGRLHRDRGCVPGSLLETKRALAGAGKIRGARGAEESAKVVL
jgi:hypothetical protein